MWISINGMKKSLLLIAIGLLLSLGATGSSGEVGVERASGSEVAIVTSGDAPLYSKAVAGLKQYSPEIKFHHYSLEEWDSTARQDLSRQQELVVAVGAKATARILETPGNFVALSIMVPSVTFTELVKNRSQAQQKINDGKLSAIFMDQPASRQIKLAKIIAPELTTIGTLYEERSQTLADQLSQTARENQLQFKAIKLSRDDNPIVALRKLYRDIDLFIAIPGKYIFNKSTAKWMLYLSYKNKKPLLGFSSDYVNAGALAAVYSKPESIALEAAQWIKFYQQDKRLRFSPSYPSYYDVRMNPEVAEKLNAKLDSDAVLKWELNKLESNR